MSKIQKALARVQSSPNQKRQPVVAKPTLTDTAEIERIVGMYAYRGKALEFDYDLLRQEHLIASEDVSRVLADEYRQIKRPVIALARGRSVSRVERGNLIMVASALSGEGKTFNCINLSLSMAREKDLSVVLVDADCAKPHLSTLFGVTEEKGFLDLLRSDDCDLEELVMPTNIPHLSVLPIGKRDDSASELLASDRMDRLAATLAESYDDRVIIFDSSPLLLTSEAPVLSTVVGQVVFVVSSNSTAQEDVLSALALLDDRRAINFVLNKSRSEQEGRAYGYGYGYSDGEE